MPFDTADSFFVHSAPSEERSEPERPLLSSVRRALQHYEAPHRIIGRINQLGSDGITHEELAWGRNKVVWTLGGRLQQHWSFPEGHEEIRAACWAYFEEHGTQRKENLSKQESQQSPLKDILVEETTSVFGPYGRVMKNQKRRSGNILQPEMSNEGVFGPGSGAIVRSVCIVFRSFARIHSDNGSEYCIHVPFLTRHAWPLYPVGLLVEQEATPEASQWMAAALEVEPILHTLSSPLKSIAPVGLAHQIRNTSSRHTMVYQDDLPYANQNTNTFSSVKDGERIIYVGPYLSTSHQVIFAVDTRMQMIHCYSYGYSPSSQIPDPSPLPNHGERPPSSTGALHDHSTQGTTEMDPLPYSQTQKGDGPSRASSQWLVEETPVPAGWRDPRPHPGESDIEAVDLMSVLNAPLLDFQEDEDEEIIGPDYWLQRLASIPIDHEA